MLAACKEDGQLPDEPGVRLECLGCPGWGVPMGSRKEAGKNTIGHDWFFEGLVNAHVCGPLHRNSRVRLVSCPSEQIAPAPS